MLYGVFSKKQSLYTGIVEYETPSGEIVSVTEVSDKQGCPNNNWEDKIDVGEVTFFVKRVTSRSDESLIFPVTQNFIRVDASSP